MKLKHHRFAFELKSLEQSGQFTGYGSVFNNTDHYRDVVMPGAFSKTLANWQSQGAFPPVLWQHNSDEPIGTFSAMSEDAKGLQVQGQLLVGDVQKATEAHALLKAGAIRGMSIGYNVPDGASTYDGKTNVNRLSAVDLWEVSVVTFPANVEAVIQSVKSIAQATPDEIEQVIRELFPATPRRLAARVANACIDEMKGGPSPDDPVERELENLIQSLKRGS